MPLTDGQHLHDRYWVANLVEQGGFGAVYKAWDVTLDRPVAIKESYEETVEGQRQFLREAQILAKLSHPNLPRVTDFFTIPEQGQYLVMDFVEGQSLEELRLLAGERLPEAQALGWIDQVLDALSYIHNQDPPVIHRDIKPSNIKVTPPDATHPQGWSMLVDFGVAKTYETHKRTTMGARAVTPGYSPIEQYGTGTTDARTDIYALGATVYTLLTGQEPPEAPRRVLRDSLAPPRELNPGLSPEVESVILKAMREDPDERFQTAAEFKAAIRGLLEVESSRKPIAGSQQPAVSSPPPVVVIEPAAQPVVEDVKVYSPQNVAQPAAAAPSPGQVRRQSDKAPGSGVPVGVGGRGGSPPAPPAANTTAPPPGRRFPWKWLGLGAVLLAGLMLVVGLGAIAVRNYILAEQSTYWHATWTVMASVPELTQTSPTQASRPTGALAALPSEAPTALSPTSAPISSPVSPTITPSPLPTMPKDTPSGPFEYTVQAGDTLAAIAVMFDSDIMTLLALNPSIDPVSQSLSVGQRILIPAQGAPIDTYTSPVDGMLMSYIPAGTFMMGSNGGSSGEQPVHIVTLDAFWMDQTEVTNAMFAQFLNAMGNQSQGGVTWLDAGDGDEDIRQQGGVWQAYAGRESNPVREVSWYGAVAYCTWAGRELPTEAQWEYAARSGLEGGTYPWGDENPSCILGAQNGAQFYDCLPDDAIRVASFAPNGYGLYDMAGNVWEWVADWYGSYSSAAVENPIGPSSGVSRALRGGSWRSDSFDLRVSNRGWYGPVFTYAYIGFRCARSP